MTALAVSAASLQNAIQRERESQLLACLTNAHQIAMSAVTVTERYTVVCGIDALKEMFRAYSLSDEAARKLAETSILCLRLFGLSLREALPGESNESNRRRSEATGATRGLCQTASALATYTERDLQRAFKTVRERGAVTAVKYVYVALRDNCQRVQRKREKKTTQVVAHPVAAHRDVAPAPPFFSVAKDDPDRLMIEEIWKLHHFDPVSLCRRLLEMGRENAALKLQLRMAGYAEPIRGK